MSLYHQYKNLWCAGLLFLFSVSHPKIAISEPTIFQLDECAGRPGVAVYYYSGLPTHPRMDISEVCLTRNGTLRAIEPMDNLTVVGEQDWSTHLENILTGENTSERRRIKMRDFSGKAPLGYGQDAGILSISLGPEAPVRWPASEYWAKGYAYSSSFENDGSTANFTSFVELFFFNHSGHRPGFGPAVFTGQFRFEAGAASVQLTDYAGTTKNLSSSFEIGLLEDGSVVGDGNIYYENVKLAGLADTEFRSVNLKVDRILGHVVGKEGKEVRLVGIASGSYVDQSGASHDLNASIQLSGAVVQ